MIFRDMLITELPDAALIIERANSRRDSEPLSDYLTDQSSIQNIQSKLAIPNAWADVAVVENDLAGVILGYPACYASNLPAEYSAAEYISLLMVEPTHWGKRVASGLLESANQRAIRNDRSQIVLLTREKDNAHARAVYEYRGFEQTGFTRSSRFGKQLLYLLNL